MLGNKEVQKEVIGIILSGSTSMSSKFQILENYESGKIHEGMLVVVECTSNYSQNKPLFLARIAQIIPHNSFYHDGDLWSSARRMNKEFPKDVANEFEVGSLDLLMELGGHGSDIRFPPKPGDKVLKIDPEKNIKDLFGVDKNEVGYIWYGSFSGYKNVELPLKVENIPMHMAIFGVTGSGKSFSTGALIEKLSAITINKSEQISYPMVIIDANGDYKDYFDHFYDNSLEPLERKIGAIGSIKRFVFSNSPELLKNPNENLQRIGIDLNKIYTRDLANMILAFYKGGIEESSSLSLSLLDSVLTDINENGSGDINYYFLSQNNFNELLEKVQTFGQEQKMYHSSSIAAVRRALNRFYILEKNYKIFSINSELRDNNFIDKLVKTGSMYIIDFSADGAPGVDIETKQFVMGYIAKHLFTKFTEYKSKDVRMTKYCLFLIEEAQNFCPGPSYPVGSSVAHETLSLIATQGRKFGLSLCLVSQRPSFLDRIVVSMCNTFFIHRISPDDVSFVKSVTGGLPASLERKLTLLQQGDLIITGQMTTVPFPFLINIRKGIDKKIEHKAGSTNVIECLKNNRNL